MENLKLFMLLLGAKPPGRHTEQHDIFFSIGRNLKDLVPSIYAFWPEAGKKVHIDAWREVTMVNGYRVQVVPKQEQTPGKENAVRLFFLNLGGYKPGEFEEYHYKMIMACADKGTAVQASMKTAFYRHTGFTGATSHIDDKYGVDVDDLYEIEDILPEKLKEEYTIILNYGSADEEDETHLGYFKLDKL